MAVPLREIQVDLIENYLSGKMGSPVDFASPRRSGVTTGAAVFAADNPLVYVNPHAEVRSEFLVKVSHVAGYKEYDVVLGPLGLIITKGDGTGHMVRTIAPEEQRLDGNWTVFVDDPDTKYTPTGSGEKVVVRATLPECPA